MVEIGLHISFISQSIFEENAAMSAEQARKVIDTMKVCTHLSLAKGVVVTVYSLLVYLDCLTGQGVLS